MTSHTSYTRCSRQGSSWVHRHSWFEPANNSETLTWNIGTLPRAQYLKDLKWEWSSHKYWNWTVLFTIPTMPEADSDKCSQLGIGWYCNDFIIRTVFLLGLYQRTLCPLWPLMYSLDPVPQNQQTFSNHLAYLDWKTVYPLNVEWKIN